MKFSSRLQFISRAAPALFAAAVLTLSFSTEAQAQSNPDCSSLSSPVFIAGSSAVKNFLAVAAKGLASLDTPITAVYQGQGSCIGVNYMVDGADASVTGTGTYWDADGNELQCDLTASPNVDIGVSDVYADSCLKGTGMDLASDVEDHWGPIQAMTFVVPHDSTQTSISAEAAYLVYGLGTDGDASPWTDETLIQQRSETSGTQQMISAAIRVPASKFKGNNNAGTSDVGNSLIMAAANGDAEASIGIASTDYADKNRSDLTVLAFQYYGQSCGYWPDSSPSAFDKINVRDGHYMIWGPLHMLAHTGSGGGASADTKEVLDLLSGAKTLSGLDLIKTEAEGGVVAPCAMRVARDSEVGPLMSYQPDKSCGCKFEHDATGSTPDGCKECNSDSDCPDSAPSCNYNFCEVQ